MTEQISKQPETLVQLSSHEMQKVLGGATVVDSRERHSIDIGMTYYVGTANGGVWKTTNF